jgi:hypothetical protein
MRRAIKNKKNHFGITCERGENERDKKFGNFLPSALECRIVIVKKH